ncbi:MAG: hypothetical protein VX951_07230 [Planctomycetota bacterium]|nr:hypothetical protein [Planctomycetota bacterium]
MQQSGMDSGFEAFRRDLVVKAEVDEFFSDASKLAASVVQRVAEGRERELTARLRHEMEEFLVETIWQAARLMKSLPGDPEDGGEAAASAKLEQRDELEPDACRSVDKSLGDTEVPPVDQDLLVERRMHIREEELALDCSDERQSLESGSGEDYIAGVGVIQPDDQTDLEPTGDHPAPGLAGSVTAADKCKLIRETLLSLVRAGVLTECQARSAYLSQTQAL